MKFFYGTDNVYADITNIVLKKCIKNGKIIIPASYVLRCKIFRDPIKKVVKHIKVVDNYNNSIIFDQNKEIEIDNTNFNLSEYVFYRTPSQARKHWWESKGKFLQNKGEQLVQLKSLIKLENGILEEKLGEQIMAITFINPDDIVLEIGGNIGRTSLIISSLLKDENNLVSIDSNPDHFKKLNYNKNINEMDFKTEEVAISSKDLIQRRSETKVSDVILPGFFKINTITWETFRNKYNMQFNVLFIHCGHALINILDSENSFFDNFDRVILINDFKDILEKNYVDKNLKKYNFKPIFTRGGGKGLCKDFYYQVWKKEIIVNFPVKTPLETIKEEETIESSSETIKEEETIETPLETIKEEETIETPLETIKEEDSIVELKKKRKVKKTLNI